jgi:hypothetical protein
MMITEISTVVEIRHPKSFMKWKIETRENHLHQWNFKLIQEQGYNAFISNYIFETEKEAIKAAKKQIKKTEASVAKDKELGLYIKVGRKMYDLNSIEDNEDRVKIILEKIQEIEQEGNPLSMHSIKQMMNSWLEDEDKNLVFKIAKGLGMDIHHIHMAGKYAKDKLTRAEVEKIGAKVAPILMSNATRFQLAGSYRRGKQEIGDMDYVVTDCNLEDVLAEIQLTFKTLEIARQGSAVMTVVVQLGNKKEAQVEFLNVKDNEFGSALIHSTGSGEFNLGIRAYAKSKGLLLNQHGLFIASNKKNLASETESKVFLELGLREIPAGRRGEPWSKLKKEFMSDPSKNTNLKNTKIAGGKNWVVKSKSDPNKKYLVALKDGVWSCRDMKTGEICLGLLYSKIRPKACRHILFIQKKLN